MLAATIVEFLLSGCGRPPVTAKHIPSSVLSYREDNLDPALLTEVLGEREGDAYRLGPGDALLVAVYGHPELSIAPFVAGTAPAAAPGPQGGRPVGLLVDNDGTVQLPLIGTLNVLGLTSQEVRALVETQLATYIKEPRITVQVLFAGNIRYYLLGVFTAPGLKYSDRPLGLLEALSLGGTVDLERASLATSYVARKGRKLPVDFRRLILEGDLQQNIRLKTGDIIVVPDHQNEQAFVFGGVAGSNPKGGAVAFIHGRLNLLQALASAGFGLSERFQGDLKEVYVVRSQGAKGELFTINAWSMLEGDALPFDLVPGDIVYVPPTGLASWNQALSLLLPSLQTISGVLSPFVELKYLSQ
jgi:polysaccharide export outer membrane protein